MGFWDFLRGKKPAAPPDPPAPPPVDDGKRRGPFTETLDDGGRREGTYVDGEIDGEVLYYRPTGELRSRITYRAGKREGRMTVYHPDGALELEVTLVGGWAFGPWLKYGPDGTLVERGTHIADGERDGTWESWTASGTPQEKGTYQAGKRDGMWESWTESGAPSEKGNYKAGTRVGAWRIERAGGYAEGTFADDGTPTGEWRSVRADGTVRTSGVFVTLDELETWEKVEDSLEALAGLRDVLEVANVHKDRYSKAVWTDAKSARERLASELERTIVKLPRDDERLPGLVERVLAALGRLDAYAFKELLHDANDPRVRFVRSVATDHGNWPAASLAVIRSIAHQIEKLAFYEDDFPDGVHLLFEGVDYPVLRRLSLGGLDYVDEDSKLRALNAIIEAPWLANIETLDLDFWLTDDNLARLFQSPHFRVRELRLSQVRFGAKLAAVLRERDWAVEELVVHSGSFSRDALFALCAQRSLRTVEIEDVELPSITAAEARRLGEQMALTKLDVSQSLGHADAKCEVEEAVRRLLAMPLLRTVEVLSITTEDAGNTLVTELAKCPHLGALKKLRAYNNKLDDAAQAALKAALPHVEMHL